MNPVCRVYCGLLSVVWSVCAGQLLAEPPERDHGPIVAGVKPIERYTSSVPPDPPVRFDKVLALEGDEGQGSYRVAFSPDGTLLAACRKGGHKPYDAVVWDVKRRKMLQVFRHPEGKDLLTAVAFVPPGDRLVTSRVALNKVFLWDVPTGRLLDTLDAGGEPRFGVTDVAAFPDGKRVLLCADTGLIVWDLMAKTHKALPMDVHVPLQPGESRERPRRCDKATFTVDGSRFASTVATSFFAPRILLWDAKTCQIAAVIAAPVEYSSLAYDPKARYVATRYSDLNNNNKHPLGVWDTATQELSLAGCPFDGPVQALTYTRDGRYLVMGGRHKPPFGPGGEPLLGVWDAATGELVNCIDREDGGIDGLAVSPDNKLLAIGGHNIDIYAIHYADKAASPKK